MDIQFDRQTKLSELQSLFQKRFNFLKIEFFRNKSGKEVKYTPQDILDSAMRIQEVSPQFGEESLTISGLQKVGELEKNFSEKLGIHVQVFRKSGKVWLITSSSDHLTLNELNKESRERETSITETPEDTDYHEQE